VGLPLLYFGIQAALIPLVPGYDACRQIVSLLGVQDSPYARVFNAAMVASGLCGLAGAVGLFRSGGRNWIAPAVALAGTGLGNAWAGIFPLPDPRHLSNPLLPALILLPVTLPIASWRDPRLRRLRLYLLFNLGAYFGLSVFRLLAPETLPGLVQRVHALTLYVPAAFVALAFLRSGGKSAAAAVGEG
jgi:hypothetical membrane protein